MNKRLIDLNNMGISLETCHKAEEIAKLLELDDNSISFFGDAFEDPPVISIFDHISGLMIEISYLPPESELPRP